LSDLPLRFDVSDLDLFDVGGCGPLAGRHQLADVVHELGGLAHVVDGDLETAAQAQHVEIRNRHLQGHTLMRIGEVLVGRVAI
jgi:hypothetical protein